MGGNPVTNVHPIRRPDAVDTAKQFAAELDTPGRPPTGCTPAAASPPQEGETAVSTKQDTYEAAPMAVTAALHALADAHFARTEAAFDAEPYSERDHVKTVARHGGVCDSYMLVHGMLRDYRAAKAGVA